jgi:two-component system phosphate regulon sensor histidine kinase PhoR
MPPDLSTTDVPSWRASLATMLERLRRGDSGQLLRAALPPLLPALAVLLVLPLAPGPWLLRGSLAFLAAIATALVIAAMSRLERQRLELWLAGLNGVGSADGTGLPSHPEADGIIRPVAGLARRLRRAERESALHQRLIGQLVEALPDPILLVDSQLVVVQANTAARRSFKIDHVPIAIGLVLRDPGLLAALGAALEGKATSDLTFRPSADQRKQFAAHVERVDLPDRQSGALLALREETEQLMIERMRSDFVANASHEIRNPLAALVGIIETLQGPAKDDAEAREAFLDIMRQETARMTRLVDDLLSLSRIELAADQPPAETCDLDDIIAGVMDSARPFAASHGATLEWRGERQLPQIQGTPDQLHQLFTNLVDNAVKYGGRDHTVVVETAVLDPAPVEAGALAGRRAVAVGVIDQGPGIAAEHIPRLTERFYRVDKARSRNAGGTGLGLAIVKHITRRHRGELLIESELGRGSTFRLYFPAPAAT